METKTISLNEITAENVNNFSEEDVSVLLSKLVSDLPRSERTPYVQILNNVFEFRSISTKNRMLRKDLEMYGFKFFSIPVNQKLIMGVRRKVTN